MTMQATSLISLGLSQISYNKKLDTFNGWEAKYQKASKSYFSEQQAWKNLTEAHNQLDEAFNMRRIIIYSAITIYALNVLDALALFPKNWRQIEIVGMPLSDRSLQKAGGIIQLSWAF